jgi:hypothetical protein
MKNMLMFRNILWFTTKDATPQPSVARAPPGPPSLHTKGRREPRLGATGTGLIAAAVEARCWQR